MPGASSHAEVAGTYSSTHPMEGEGPRRGHYTWMLVARDGPQAPTIRTHAELEALLGEMVRRDAQPDAWEETFVLRLGSYGCFAFRGPLGYGDASTAVVSGTWRLAGDDVVLCPARATREATRILEHEMRCPVDKGRLYFPWGDQSLVRQELVLVKR